MAALPENDNVSKSKSTFPAETSKTDPVPLPDNIKDPDRVSIPISVVVLDTSTVSID